MQEDITYMIIKVDSVWDIIGIVKAVDCTETIWALVKVLQILSR